MDIGFNDVVVDHRDSILITSTTERVPHMPPWVIDLVTLLIIVGVTIALMSEGLWGAALMFFNILFAGLIAFNFYEPLAAILASNVEFLSGFADTLCLLGIFVVTVLILRLTTDSLGPAMVRFPTPIYHLGRISFGVGGALVLASILLLGFHTAPIHKKIFGVIDYKYRPPFGWGLDHQWLGFFQHTSGQVFARYGTGDPDPYREYGNEEGVNVFDPRAEWLIRHQEARPYGEGPILESAAPAGGSTPGGAVEGGSDPAAGSGGTGPGSRGNAPVIPGGTAGAAVGLAPVGP